VSAWPPRILREPQDGDRARCGWRLVCEDRGDDAVRGTRNRAQLSQTPLRDYFGAAGIENHPVVPCRHTWLPHRFRRSGVRYAFT